MKRIGFLFFFLFAGLSIVAGQSPWPPVYELRADTAVEKLDDQYWQILEDTSGNLTISEVTQAPVSLRFHANNTVEAGLGYSGVKDYWVRLRMKNSSGKDQRFIFAQRPRVLKKEMYIFRKTGPPERKLTGWGVPLNQKSDFKTREGILVYIATGEEVILYLKLELYSADLLKRLYLGFTSYDKFIVDNYINEPLFVRDTRASFIAGFMLFGFILNIFFYRIVREKVYLYYSFFLLLEGIWYLNSGTWLFFKKNPVLSRYFDLVFTFGLFFFCLTQFVRHFLKTYKYYPRWDMLLKVLIGLNLGTAFLVLYVDTITPYSWKGIPNGIQDLFFILNNLALFITFMFRKKEKDRFTVLSVIAAAPAFFVWSFVYGISNLLEFHSARFENFQPRTLLTWLDRNSPVIEMFCVAWFAILFTWILLQRYALLRKQLTQQALEREREKTELMMLQKDELERKVEERTSELKQSIEELKTTQKQLFHSEKMASLGELTAGIAHEIQNPLNFVNNFSEVNTELIDEMEQELEKGNLDDAKNIAKDIKENEQKINHHGKRADSIVKGMLQHSRSSNGQKEPADINVLADECMRLSYHGLRAKDKSFNAKTGTDFDSKLPKVNIVAQDVGRVILNLFTNAFYSVMQKKKERGDSFEPIVTVKTNLTPASGDKQAAISISIRDNGNGVPQKVIEKIFQPFFTTKPVGEGTGLGLSMSYEIITKGHGGELKVDSREGEYAEFTIILPI